jgi:nicotinamidase-related amidase
VTTALVLLDIQRGILASDAIRFEDPARPAAVLESTGALLAAARRAGSPVIHVGVVRAERRGSFDDPRTAAAKSSGKTPRDMLPLAAGSPEVEFLHPVLSGEEVVHKMGVSAFEGTRLDQLLRSAGAQEVIVAGAFTHMVVESTVRQGFDLGYRMTVASDGCCAPRNALHDNALTMTLPNFAVVEGSAIIVARLASGERVAT